MDPISAATTAWAVGSHAVDLLKGAAEQAKALGKAEIISSLIDVQMAMMQVLAEQQKLLDENRQLQERVRDLEEALRQQQAQEYHHNAYWRRLPDDSLDGPFSSQEWDRKKVLVRLPHYGTDRYDGVQKARFYDQPNKENVFVPLEFLITERVKAFAKS